MSHSMLSTAPEPAAAANRPPSVLLRSLLDASIVHPEDWDALSSETREQVMGMGADGALLEKLVELGALNAYQAGRIKAGSADTLVIGTYRVLGSLGAGGSGVIFEAEHILMRRKIALKVFPFASDKPSELIARFLREMRAVARLDHPNIVAAFDAGICPGSHPGQPDLYYFAMEHLTGQDLEQHARQQPLAIADACGFVYQIASALDEAHRHGLVHRDIKPSNIFITAQGQAKLLDFGLVRHTLGDAVTLPNVVVGTLEYMAPEQAADPTCVDIRTDIFALGAALFYALTGVSPFPSEGPLREAALRRRRQPPLSARGLRSDIPVELEEMLERMIALDPEDRFQAPQAVMHALLPFLGNHSHSSRRPAETAGDRLSPVAQVPGSRPARVLLADADEARRGRHARTLAAAGLDCSESDSPPVALKALRDQPVEALLVTLSGSHTDGPGLVRGVRDNPPFANLKVILMGESITDSDMAVLLAAGADDVLRLPLSNVQITARVKAAIRHKEAQDRTDQLSRELLDLNTELERGVSARTVDLVQSRNAMVLGLARLVEYRSIETHAHLSRMQRYCLVLAQEAADGAAPEKIDLEFLQTLECCVPLHDIGNVTLPDHVLLKPGRLDEEESKIMRTHTTIGAETLELVARQFGARVGFLSMAIDIARHHHENYDGTGYPDGLWGNEIPLAARIAAIADGYDALRSRRAQRPGLSHAAALRILLENSPGRFDPKLLGAFERCAGQFERIFRELPDTINVE